MMGPLDRLDAITADLRRQAANAARRNKPTMWAYFVDVEAGLRVWFSGTPRTDGAIAGAALALSQKAVRLCPDLPPADAARLWALGVYAKRVLRAWGVTERVSLEWLHRRGKEGAV